MAKSSLFGIQTNGVIMTMGEILVEIMATERGQSFRAPGLLIGPYASGAPAIFIDQVARAGSRCAMIGCVGDDDFGVLNVERLRADGVDVSAIDVRRHETTGSAFVTYRDDGERDFIYNIANSASAKLSEAQVSEARLKDCAHFHVMGSSLFSAAIIDAVKKAVRIVKAQGGTVSFDPNARKEILNRPGMREAFDHLIASTDVFLPSGHEVTLLTQADSEEAAIEELLGRGVREIVVKQGAQGCRLYDGGQRLDHPAFAVEEVDPTGAGDCFGATYIACRMQGMDAERALRYASASGARAVQAKGPMEGTSTLAQLDQFISEH
ncbi:sugar kinase [Caballeronia sp. LZ034LL]|uniref:tagatose kinase n=1 Tax=Caballeronia sp. LZ034LL TaxID=3038567 RepID=UPI002862F461|nr:sugar kinase [Caballeronia sp. LZ034LL]MDR5837031.1 sugar kinase [Caballeronia sp. LZ034LL]